MNFFARKEKGVRSTLRRETDFRRNLFFGVVRLVLTVLALIIVWYVTRLPFFTISEVTVSGGETINLESIEDLVESELTGTYVLLIPKRFSYLYPHDRVREVVEKEKRIHSVTVTRESRTSLAVHFKEYEPFALWCHETGVPCFFIDSSGYTFEESPALNGGAFVRHYASSEVKEGEVVLPKEKLEAIHAFIERAENELSLRITTVRHTADGDLEFLINGGGVVFASSEKSLDETFENLKIVLSSESFDHLKPGNFQYVDVRFDNKVFVNEELGSPETSTEATTTLQ